MKQKESKKEKEKKEAPAKGKEKAHHDHSHDEKKPEILVASMVIEDVVEEDQSISKINRLQGLDSSKVENIDNSKMSVIGNQLIGAAKPLKSTKISKHSSKKVPF